MQSRRSDRVVTLAEHRPVKGIDQGLGRLRADNEQATIEKIARDADHAARANLRFSRKDDLSGLFIIDGTLYVIRRKSVPASNCDKHVGFADILALLEKRLHQSVRKCRLRRAFHFGKMHDLVRRKRVRDVGKPVETESDVVAATFGRKSIKHRLDGRRITEAP